MLWLVWLLAIACLSCGVPAHAQESGEAQPVCPWLTLGSAAHALDGEVRAVVVLKNKLQGVCTFTRLDARRGEIDIFVGGTDSPACPNDSVAIAGIGTRAFQCSLKAPRRQPRPMLSGGVRDRRFAVVITDEAADGLKPIAEMVAGSLF